MKPCLSTSTVQCNSDDVHWLYLWKKLDLAPQTARLKTKFGWLLVNTLHVWLLKTNKQEATESEKVSRLWNIWYSQGTRSSNIFIVKFGWCQVCLSYTLASSVTQPRAWQNACCVCLFVFVHCVLGKKKKKRTGTSYLNRDINLKILGSAALKRNPTQHSNHWDDR